MEGLRRSLIGAYENNHSIQFVSSSSSRAQQCGVRRWQGLSSTGPILEVNDSMIAVQKGKDRWEIARDANTKASSEMKVGDKVTVHYTMTATNIEVKAGKAEGAAKGAQKKE